MNNFRQLQVHLGQRLKELRMKRGLTIEVLTGLLGVDFSNYSCMETAKRSNPTLETLYKLAEFYGVPIDYFFQNYSMPGEIGPDNPAERKLLSLFRKMKADSRQYCLRFLDSLKPGK